MSSLASRSRENTTTHVSLLDVQRWDEFDELYRPFVAKWLRVLRERRRISLSPEDADEVTQRVMVRVYERLASFRHNGHTGAFRNWLRTVTSNCLWDYLRSKGGLGGSDCQELMKELEDPAGEMSGVWDHEYHRHIVQCLLGKIAHEFEPATWSAFLRVTLQEETVADVAAKLGITPNAVRIARSRVLRRLREEGADILDSTLELPGRQQPVEEILRDETDAGDPRNRAERAD
jgi:RNA polymerase sigma-70 factor (ECF subfamily)